MLLGLGIAVIASAEIVPPARRIVWQPGIPGGIPDKSVACPASAPSVKDFGAVGDGVVDDADLLIVIQNFGRIYG